MPDMREKRVVFRAVGGLTSVTVLTHIRVARSLGHHLALHRQQPGQRGRFRRMRFGQPDEWCIDANRFALEHFQYLGVGIGRDAIQFVGFLFGEAQFEPLFGWGFGVIAERGHGVGELWHIEDSTDIRTFHNAG